MHSSVHAKNGCSWPELGAHFVSTVLNFVTPAQSIAMQILLCGVVIWVLLAVSESFGKPRKFCLCISNPHFVEFILG